MRRWRVVRVTWTYLPAGTLSVRGPEQIHDAPLRGRGLGDRGTAGRRWAHLLPLAISGLALGVSNSSGPGRGPTSSACTPRKRRTAASGFGGGRSTSHGVSGACGACRSTRPASRGKTTRLRTNHGSRRSHRRPPTNPSRGAPPSTDWSGLRHDSCPRPSVSPEAEGAGSSAGAPLARLSRGSLGSLVRVPNSEAKGSSWLRNPPWKGAIIQSPAAASADQSRKRPCSCGHVPPPPRPTALAGARVTLANRLGGFRMPERPAVVVGLVTGRRPSALVRSTSLRRFR